jgi:DDE superfamily endonuclease
MLPDATLSLPASLMSVLSCFAPLFTVPSFRTFYGLACGFLAQTGKRTVCGMLTGAGLSRLWPHDRAHFFFARAPWDPDALGLAVARLVVALLVPAGQPVTVAIDDTLFRRRGKNVWAASWFHDGSAPGPAKTGYGNNWAIAAIVVKLPFLSRPVAVPVLATLVVKDTNSASRLWLAQRLFRTRVHSRCGGPPRERGLPPDGAMCRLTSRRAGAIPVCPARSYRVNGK